MSETFKLPDIFRDMEALDGVSEWLKSHELRINIGPVQGVDDEFIESSAGYLLRLIEEIRHMNEREARDVRL